MKFFFFFLLIYIESWLDFTMWLLKIKYAFIDLPIFGMDYRSRDTKDFASYCGPALMGLYPGLRPQPILSLVQTSILEYYITTTHALP